MPNIQSAKKRLRQDAVRNERNRAARSFVRNRVKNLIKTLQAGNFEEADIQFKAVCSALDKAAAHNLCHRNTAARKKSRLSKLIVKTKEDKSQVG
ncbi:MAG: 30S ribosomal protein S20 [Planctomycetia bacterium]|nr:30S ribosomal protein S20 [Planctomycetia bacterium]